MSSCSASSLICCELCFFFYFSVAFCLPVFVPLFLYISSSSTSLPLMLNLLLRFASNTIHPLPLPPCLQEFVPHYRSLLPPNQPSHPAWCHSFSTVLSHYLRRHQRGRAFWDIRHSPSVRGLRATDRADRWLSQAKGFIWPLWSSQTTRWTLSSIFACASRLICLSWATLISS